MTHPPAFPLEPIPIHLSDEALDELRVRLALTRPPLDEGNGVWFYGVPDGYLRGLVAYWRDGYDRRKAEAAINAPEHEVTVSGISVHFMRKPGRGPCPIPLILTHGWPWTFWHWSKVIDPLADGLRSLAYLMTDTLGYREYAAGGCDIGGQAGAH
jgi:hypothetical protein